jgi:hypothetical protein
MLVCNRVRLYSASVFVGASSGGSFSKGFAQNYFAYSLTSKLNFSDITVLFENIDFKKQMGVKK